MMNAKFWSRSIAPATALLLSIVSTPAAHALVIDATTTFDDVFSFGPTSGSFNIVSGGSLTTATYADNAATANPLTGPLSDLFDGTGFDGTASASLEGFLVGFDTVVTVFNDEAVAKEVKFRLDYINRVNADGEDAYASSNLFLFDDITPGDLFFSDLTSDTAFGDLIGGNPTGGAGEALVDSGTMTFSYLLNPFDTLELTMSWTLEGEDFASGIAEASLSANLTVVPLPGSLLFMVSGMLLLPLQRLLRK